MTTTTTNGLAVALIARSQSHNEIAEAVWTEGAHAALAGLADDWTDTNDGYDYWGADADGKWRVELSVAAAVAAAAADIIGPMTDDDIAEFDREGWRAGVSAMLVDNDCNGVLDLDDVLDAMAALLAERQEVTS